MLFPLISLPVRFSKSPICGVLHLLGCVKKHRHAVRVCVFLRKEWDSNPRGREPKRFSRLLRVVVGSGYFMAAWLISVPLKSLSHKAFCLVLNRSNPNRINSNRTAFLKISLKSLTFERIWRELDTKKLKMQYSEVGLYWREFLP